MDWKSLLTMTNILIAAGIPLVLLGIIFLVVWIKRNNFKKRLTEILKNPALIDGKYSDYFSPERIMRYSDLLEKTAVKEGVELFEITGISNLWLTELRKRKTKKLYRRVLYFYPERGLFTCFLIALERKDYGAILREWLESSEEFLLMRRIALSGVGEEFSGEKALEYFGEKLPQIREMTGDPMWASRYFAIKILLYDNQEQSVRAIWESFTDPHPLIRKTIAKEFQTENRDKFYNELYRLYLNDPVREVRAAAKDRINADFTDVYSINFENLEEYNALHALEHLSPYSKSDEDTALRFLDSDNLELRFAAALFLEKRDAQKRLLEDADLGDRENLERSLRLLRKSCEVHITSFLESAVKTNNTGSYFIAIELLTESGEASLIEPLCRKIFSLPLSSPENIELYEKSLKCINKKGTDHTLVFLNEHLKKNRDNRKHSSRILESIPSRGAVIFVPTLMNLLCDSSFPERDKLREALSRMPSDLYIGKLLEIIKSDRGTYDHIVRKDALKILVLLKKSFCLQTILENLPILPNSEARELAALLTEYNSDDFNRLTRLFLDGDDGSVRASIISCLPAVNGKEFLKDIKKSLGDADPEVRIASIRALVEFNDTKTISSAASLLRDPVERVRIEVSLAIAQSGSDTAILELKNILFDLNEIDSVKIPVIRGLGFSKSIVSIEILTDLLDKIDDYDDSIAAALSVKISKKEITRLIEIFKDGSPKLRDKISIAFSAMREKGEDMMISLLKEDITALKPHICEVLENTGFIENQIRLLKHRDPSIRRQAADQLSYIGTSSAFRGIVLAARDSNNEVRIAVTKALEQLNNDEGTEILHSLESDPDRKVRKYTAWALARLNSKNT